jgi:hypothetical protein
MTRCHSQAFRPIKYCYRGEMPPSSYNTNSSVEQIAQAVSGTISPSNLSDWSEGHTIVDWPALLLNDAVIIAGVGLIVWIIVRKRK